MTVTIAGGMAETIAAIEPAVGPRPMFPITKQIIAEESITTGTRIAVEMAFSFSTLALSSRSTDSAGVLVLKLWPMPLNIEMIPIVVRMKPGTIVKISPPPPPPPRLIRNPTMTGDKVRRIPPTQKINPRIVLLAPLV
jgi:hypothetical protein